MPNFLFWSWGEKEKEEIKFEYKPIDPEKLEKLKQALKEFEK